MKEIASTIIIDSKDAILEAIAAEFRFDTEKFSRFLKRKNLSMVLLKLLTLD